MSGFSGTAVQLNPNSEYFDGIIVGATDEEGLTIVTSTKSKEFKDIYDDSLNEFLKIVKNMKKSDL